MRKKHAKIIVTSISKTEQEWTAALKGKKRKIQKDDEIIFTSLDAVARIFSKTRMEILRAVIQKKPKSIYELAKILDRDFKNVHSDVKLLANIGLIELRDTRNVKNARKGLTPEAKFSGIDLDFAA